MSDNIKSLISITKANQNFSQVAKKIEKEESVNLLKNNASAFDLTDDEKIEIIAKGILKKHKKAFEVLGKWLNLVKKVF